MITRISGWFTPSSQPGQTKNSSALPELIAVVALGAIALIAAHSCDYQAPGLALLLRCVPIGLSLIWLFRHYVYVPGRWYFYTSPQPAPIIIQQQAPVQSHWWTWFGSSQRLHTAPVTRQQQFAVPAQPTVYVQPAPFPAVRPAAAQPVQYMHTAQVMPPQNLFPAVQPTSAQPVQQSMRMAPAAVPQSSFPAVQPTSAQSYIAPTVQRAQPQAPANTFVPSAPPQVQQAPAPSGSFPAVRPAAAQQTAPAQQPLRAAPSGRNAGDDRLLFQAAATRT